MAKFIIERDIPGAGKLTPLELGIISQAVSRVVAQLGPRIEWIRSYIADDKVYCEYDAEKEEIILEHARLSKFVISRISKVKTVLCPIEEE